MTCRLSTAIIAGLHLRAAEERRRLTSRLTSRLLHSNLSVKTKKPHVDSGLLLVPSLGRVMEKSGWDCQTDPPPRPPHPHPKKKKSYLDIKYLGSLASVELTVLHAVGRCVQSLSNFVHYYFMYFPLPFRRGSFCSCSSKEHHRHEAQSWPWFNTSLSVTKTPPMISNWSPVGAKTKMDLTFSDTALRFNVIEAERHLRPCEWDTRRTLFLRFDFST